MFQLGLNILVNRRLETIYLKNPIIMFDYLKLIDIFKLNEIKKCSVKIHYIILFIKSDKK